MNARDLQLKNFILSSRSAKDYFAIESYV
ncbi:hypothetical protein JL09_g6728 [Pichia kudriavzevii]|uniref:Uncharacterized protein n=1 Tax=Pichia kudriavzevii TaxID=4909 RepID=A0A099NJB9_PICKU|nr:hypothetical protein JL09_g6728 [Pichia kudriavzevii]